MANGVRAVEGGGAACVSWQEKGTRRQQGCQKNISLHSLHKKTAAFATAVLKSSCPYAVAESPSASGAVICGVMFEEVPPLSEQFNDRQQATTYCRNNTHQE